MATSQSSRYRYSNKWLGQPRPVHVIVVGAGISGIAAVKLFKEKFRYLPTSLVLYEKNDDVGGTWLENRYPGCSCDIPAHGYTYSWEGNPDWSGVYVGSKELFDYFKGRAQAYGVFDYVKLQHHIEQATWNGSAGKWSVQGKDLRTGKSFIDEAEVLINAGGFLNRWKWPDIPQVENFNGELVHSAHWNDTISFDGRRVAVIGNGSSAIQIVPQLQKVVKHLISFSRSPTWITPEFAADMAPGGRETKYTARQKEEWRMNPAKFLAFRKEIESGANRYFDLQRKDSDIQQTLFEKYSRDMSSILDKKGLSATMVPKFAVGCRRMTPGLGYLEALVADNVAVEISPIKQFTETGIETKDGKNHAVDVIVCATGFDNSYRPNFPVIGEDGRDLCHEWQDEPRSYISIAIAGFPNYFMATGPNFPLANGSLIACLEQTVEYAFNVVHKIQCQGIKSLSPKVEAVNDFQEHKDSIMEDLVWTSSCRSWYKNGKEGGKVWGPWPGSVLHFKELLGQPRWEDYNITYQHCNRFEFLGNGKSSIEATGGDLAWYVTVPGVHEDDKMAK